MSGLLVAGTLIWPAKLPSAVLRIHGRWSLPRHHRSPRGLTFSGRKWSNIGTEEVKHSQLPIMEPDIKVVKIVSILHSKNRCSLYTCMDTHYIFLEYALNKSTKYRDFEERNPWDSKKNITESWETMGFTEQPETTYSTRNETFQPRTEYHQTNVTSSHLHQFMLEAN